MNPTIASRASGCSRIISVWAIFFSNARGYVTDRTYTGIFRACGIGSFAWDRSVPWVGLVFDRNRDGLEFRGGLFQLCAVIRAEFHTEILWQDIFGELDREYDVLAGG